MDYILLVLAIVLAVSKNLISKIGKNEFEGLDRLMSANMLAAVTAMVLFACSGMKLSVMADPIFILLAFLYGVFILAAQSLYMLALKSGSVSICSLIISSVEFDEIYVSPLSKNPYSVISPLTVT